VGSWATLLARASSVGKQATVGKASRLGFELEGSSEGLPKQQYCLRELNLVTLRPQDAQLESLIYGLDGIDHWRMRVQRDDPNDEGVTQASAG
jgi:hypothetical protein